MIATDTNIIIRFLVKDDPEQAEAVRRMLKEAEQQREHLLIPLLVLLETIWVLESVYNKTATEIIDAINDLRLMSVFMFESDSVVERFISKARKFHADLSDILITESCQMASCEYLITFDKKASKLPSVRLLKTH